MVCSIGLVATVVRCADHEVYDRAMLHDERVYPEPGRFNPDRFLAGEGRTPQNDPREVAFGFGRR